MPYNFVADIFHT